MQIELSGVEKMLIRKLELPTTVRMGDVFDAHDLRKKKFKCIIKEKNTSLWTVLDSNNLQYLERFNRFLVTIRNETVVMDYHVWEKASTSNPYKAVCSSALVHIIEEMKN